MDETLITYLEPPRFEDGKPLLIAGLCERYGEDFDPMSGIGTVEIWIPLRT